MGMNEIMEKLTLDTKCRNEHAIVQRVTTAANLSRVPCGSDKECRWGASIAENVCIVYLYLFITCCCPHDGCLMYPAKVAHRQCERHTWTVGLVYEKVSEQRDVCVEVYRCSPFWVFVLLEPKTNLLSDICVSLLYFCDLVFTFNLCCFDFSPPVPPPDHPVHRFAGRTVTSSSLVLVTVATKEEGAAQLTVNCEKMVIGTMLVKDVLQALTQ